MAEHFANRAGDVPGEEGERTSPGNDCLGFGFVRNGANQFERGFGFKNPGALEVSEGTEHDVYYPFPFRVGGKANIGKGNYWSLARARSLVTSSSKMASTCLR